MAIVPASAYRAAPELPTGSALAPPRPPGELPKGTTLTGVLVLLVADAMVLATLLATWFLIKGGSPTWPPKGVHLQTYLPTVVTITAAMSAFSVSWAASSIRRNDQRNATMALILTVVLGLAIVNAQWYSIVRAKFDINAHAYGTLYYLLIGYHVVHLAIAIGALVLVGARTLAGHFGREGYDPMRAAAAFWQYGNVAWASILLAVFLFSRHAH
jgi:heme/copper-type cytochrome/quinol oxidase subunit 3